MEKREVPLWEKYTLTIPEASRYFGIGEKKLRNIVEGDPRADYIIWNNSRPQIKRKIFEQFIDQISSL